MGLRMDDLHAPTVGSGPTSQATSNGEEKQLSLQELISKKENIEAELSALGSVLDSHGVNMNTSLTTFDGYPRADIDVAQIRTTRARIVRLKNDHKAVMAKVETAVHQHFEAGKPVEQSPSSQTQSGRGESGSRSSSVEPPFAKVDSVMSGSPADEAGLQVGDKIVKFGDLNWSNHDRLAKLIQVVQQNQNRRIAVRILRDANPSSSTRPIDLTLTPRAWDGRGTLGCHLVPL